MKRTVSYRVTKQKVSPRRHHRIHQVLEHNVLGILGTDTTNFQQAKSRLKKKAHDSHDQDKEQVHRRVDFRDLSL